MKGIKESKNSDIRANTNKKTVKKSQAVENVNVVTITDQSKILPDSDVMKHMNYNKSINIKEDSKFTYNWIEVLIFMKDDIFYIYKLFEDDDEPKVYKQIPYNDLKGNLHEVLGENSVHMARLIYDPKDDNDFTVFYYFNFYNVDMDSIISNDMLAEFIDAMEKYNLCLSENNMVIKQPDDIHKLLEKI